MDISIIYTESELNLCISETSSTFTRRREYSLEQRKITKGRRGNKEGPNFGLGRGPPPHLTYKTQHSPGNEMALLLPLVFPPPCIYSYLTAKTHQKLLIFWLLWSCFSSHQSFCSLLLWWFLFWTFLLLIFVCFYLLFSLFYFLCAFYCVDSSYMSNFNSETLCKVSLLFTMEFY